MLHICKLMYTSMYLNVKLHAPERSCVTLCTRIFWRIVIHGQNSIDPRARAWITWVRASTTCLRQSITPLRAVTIFTHSLTLVMHGFLFLSLCKTVSYRWNWLMWRYPWTSIVDGWICFLYHKWKFATPDVDMFADAGKFPHWCTHAGRTIHSER